MKTVSMCSKCMWHVCDGGKRDENLPKIVTNEDLQVSNEMRSKHEQEFRR